MTQAQDQTPTLKGRFTTATITRREDIAHDLWKIWLKPEQSFSFKPGQYCTIGAGGIERPYSIVSSPDEEEIELFIELVPLPDGNLTPILHKMGVGETVTLRPRAKGIFVIQPQFKNHVLVGTVTGTVPYVSMLRKFLTDSEWPEDKGVARSDHRFFVLEGASYVHELGYDEEFVLLGSQGDQVITAGELARQRNTIAWEVLTSMAQRLARVYHPSAGTAGGDEPHSQPRR